MIISYRNLIKLVFAYSFFIFFSIAAFAQSNEAKLKESTMIVLDRSCSMWGQINGISKLEVAKKTLREVLKNVPSNIELGLIAYGHREKGNCGDIKIIIPPKNDTASLIADKVENLKFLGKTPLSDAVQMGAEQHKRINYAYTKNGNPAQIKAPKQTGIYELRYVLNV